MNDEEIIEEALEAVAEERFLEIQNQELDDNILKVKFENEDNKVFSFRIKLSDLKSPDNLEKVIDCVLNSQHYSGLVIGEFEDEEYDF